MKNNNDAFLKKKRIYTIISAVIALIVMIFLTVVIWKWLASFSDDGFREYIRSYGAAGWLVLLVIQILQVVVAFIPGEIVESASGYIFGPFLGTVLCYVGIFISSSAVFFIVKKFGMAAVEIFGSRDKINELKFLNTEKKRDTVIFLCFFIPGTPKDLLTYFVPLTDISFLKFMVISLVARIPSVVSSTFGGHLLGEGQIVGAVIVYGITGALSIIGILFYNKIVSKKQSKNSTLE